MYMNNSNVVVAGFYEKEYYMLSNFAATAISWKGVMYPTAEHIYQSEKFVNKEIVEQIRTAASPYEAKILAHTFSVERVASWDAVKIDVMRSVLYQKAKQHQFVSEALLRSLDTALVEDSPTDLFWGAGASGMGENNLGKLWMEVRESLR